jgi:hypothetical protein
MWMIFQEGVVEGFYFTIRAMGWLLGGGIIIATIIILAVIIILLMVLITGLGNKIKKRGNTV